jgi:chaperonin GroES
MATERNPFDPIPTAEISIEIESSGTIDEDGNEATMELDPEDGGIIVEFKPPMDERSKVQQKEEPEEFYRNLAEDMDEDELEDIAAKVIDNFEADKDSRSDWESMFERGFDLLGLKLEEASEPFEGACTAVHPILIESAVKFQSKATQELFPPAGPVKSQIIGDVTEEKQDQANRVKAFMNYQVTDQITEYFDEFERMLFHLPLIGSAFKKTYFDQGLNRPVSEFVPIDQFYISYYATDLRRADRYTHVIYRSPVEMQRDIAAGMYADVDLPDASMPEQTAMAQKMDTILGLSPSSQHDPQYVLLEQHCYLDLPEQYHGEDDGLSLPYIVTIDYKSRKVLSIRRNYDIKDKRREKKIFFTHYRFVPGFGFYGLGLIHFLGNLTMTATAAMRGLVDAGQFANLPGGFKAKGLRMVGDNDPIAPGEWKEVEAVGNDLSKMIIPLPYKEPSQTLFQMLGFVSNAAQKFADSTEQVVSDAASYGPVGTTMALLEASSKFFSAIHKRLHKSQKDEFKILGRINYEYLPEESLVDIPENTLTIYKSDFDGRIDIIPVSDPNIPSNAHRMMMAQMALQLAQQSPPGMFDMEELNRSILQSANLPNLDKIMPRKPQSVPLDPISDIMAAVKGLPIKAFMGQNHDAHIQAKMAYMQDPQNGANPLMKRIAPVLEANMQEHMIMKYQEQVEGTAAQLIEQYGPEAIASGQVDPNDPRVMEMVMAEAAQKVAQANQAMAQMQQAASPEAQMVQIEQQRLQVEQAKVQAQTAKESVEAAMKNRELDLKEAQIQIDMMKEGIKTSTGIQEKEKDRNAKKAIAALDAIMELAKSQESADTAKMLKAADMVAGFVKEANKNS